MYGLADPFPGHGGGAAGVNAARMAQGLGADVTILEVDLERMRFLDITLHTAHTLYSSEAHLMDLLPDVDLLIGAVLVPGARAPKLVTREMVRSMKKGSVIVDVAIDQGGCFETSHPTTHADPTYVVDGVIHYCVANMPGGVPRTSTFALNNATLPFVLMLADKGWKKALADDPHLRNGVNIAFGKVTCKPVADALVSAGIAPPVPGFLKTYVPLSHSSLDATSSAMKTLSPAE